MNFTLTEKGLVAETGDMISVDELVRDLLSAGFDVEVTKEEVTLYTLINGEVATGGKNATVIKIMSGRR